MGSNVAAELGVVRLVRAGTGSLKRNKAIACFCRIEVEGIEAGLDARQPRTRKGPDV